MASFLQTEDKIIDIKAIRKSQQLLCPINTNNAIEANLNAFILQEQIVSQEENSVRPFHSQEQRNKH